MRFIEMDDRDFDEDDDDVGPGPGPGVAGGHWKNADAIFDSIDNQLEPFGLEIVMIDSRSDDFMWRIKARSK